MKFNQHAILTLLAVAIAAAATTDTRAAESQLITPVFISQLAEEMRANHPALQAAYARTNAAGFSIATVRTWDDPMLRGGVVAAEKTMRANDGDLIYGIEQKLPLFGKPRLARNLARAELSVETAGADYQFQTLRSDLAKQLFHTALSETITDIFEHDLRWFDTVVETAEGNYQSGQNRLMNLLQLQNERTRLTTKLETYQQQLIHERARLNRLLNRGLLTPWPSMRLPEVGPKISYSDALVGFAIKYEPKLRMMQRKIETARAAVAVTSRERLPDVSLGAQSRNFSGNGNFRQAEFIVSFNLPLFNASKYRAAIKREEAKLKAVEFDAADYAQSLREEVHDLTVKLDSVRREGIAYRDQIIPRSEQTLASAQAMWESGEVSVRDILDAHRMLLEARLMYAHAVADQYEWLSDLVLCCGLGDFEALQMLETQTESQKGK